MAKKKIVKKKSTVSRTLAADTSARFAAENSTAKTQEVTPQVDYEKAALKMENNALLKYSPECLYLNDSFWYGVFVGFVVGFVALVIMGVIHAF